MADTLTDRVVRMTPADYRAVAEEAVENAVAFLKSGPDEIGRAGRLERAAAQLQAADIFTAHAASMENFGPAFEEVLVEV